MIYNEQTIMQQTFKTVRATVARGSRRVWWLKLDCVIHGFFAFRAAPKIYTFTTGLIVISLGVCLGAHKS
jgi:hypothetical protein